MGAYERVWAYVCVSVCLLRACIWETEPDFGVGFFESERTRAKGVVAKEAWGDYKDLGL